MTILITGASAHSKELIDALRNNYDGEEISIVGINCSDNKLLRTGVDKGYVVPVITDPSYIDTLIDICLRDEVDVILPFITKELEILSTNKRRFERIGVKVSVASLEALAVANNKLELSKRYYGYKYMPIQEVARYKEDVIDFANEIGYPNTSFCVKLPSGCGGNGFMVVDEKKGLDFSYVNKNGFHRYITLDHLFEMVEKRDGEVILSEFVEGTDYSVCVLADNGKVTHICGYYGYEMDYGSVVNGEISKNDKAYEIAEKIIADLAFDGNACFDFIIKPDGTPELLEINPRLNASLPFVAKAGLNLAYLRCKQLLGTDVTKYNPTIQYGLRMSKYYESEYFV